MSSSQDSLQTRSIKQVFGNLDHKCQVDLIQDLMEAAGIETIIFDVNRLKIPKDETPEERRFRIYKRKFVDFVRPFISKKFGIVNRISLDRCFNVYQILFRNSVGGRYYSQEEDGDKHLFAITDDPRENFINEQDKRECFEKEMFEGTIKLDYITLYYDTDEIVIRIQFTDLLTILIREENKAYVVLYIMGFLNGEPELLNKAKEDFERMYPNIKNIKDIFIVWIHPQGLELECPDFPGLYFFEK